MSKKVWKARRRREGGGGGGGGGEGRGENLNVLGGPGEQFDSLEVQENLNVWGGRGAGKFPLTMLTDCGFYVAWP